VEISNLCHLLSNNKFSSNHINLPTEQTTIQAFFHPKARAKHIQIIIINKIFLWRSLRFSKEWRRKMMMMMVVLFENEWRMKLRLKTTTNLDRSFNKD
jgi:hypothetical protein